VIGLGLDGILDISLINGFTPALGETFEFLDFTGSLTGKFATLNGTTIGNGLSFGIVYEAVESVTC